MSAFHPLPTFQSTCPMKAPMRRTAIDSGEGPAPSRAIWLLPLAFVFHDAEELATRGAWLVRNRESLHDLLQRYLGMHGPELSAPMSPPATALAMSVLLMIFLGVTGGLWLSRRRIFLYGYLVVLAAFFLHGFVHLAQAALFGGYTPGMATAVLVVLPIPVFIWGHLRRRSRVPNATFVAALLLGSVAILPAILLALSIGRKLD